MVNRPEVVVVTGAGGMGVAVARRIGSGRTVLLADASASVLDRAVAELSAAGYAVRGQVTDVSDGKEVARLAALAGHPVAVVHTAGISPATGTARQIIDVDLVGTAHMIDAFLPVAEPGTSLVCVASMAGHYASLSHADEAALATADAGELDALDAVRAVEDDPLSAYILAKRGNHVRVQAAALAWNRRGARINTVSPGVIATAMSKAEAATPAGEQMMKMLDACGAGRPGTPGEIAEVVAFLTGPDARYITGTDILVDGGQAGWIRWHR
jgi:NAD(P)-dependent dehydrogenase (short-subunit alcohol dehydrogenase family)